MHEEKRASNDRTYVLRPAGEVPEESQRLDERHTAISRYLGGRLCFASVAQVRPRKIVDLGAIQAAKEFPEAEVHAIDISPLPNRILPSNIHFQLADLTKELDLEPEAFHIVHARFVMAHVVDGEGAIKRTARLVRPGGLLLIEEMDLSSMLATGAPASISARGGDGEIGSKLESIITSLGYFEDVHVNKIKVPFDGNGVDAAKNKLGLAFKKASAAASIHLVGQGVTSDMVEQYRRELSHTGNELSIYFSWAYRSVE
ncbi:hypothetical protein K438DRAFT_1997296 [Mycena galopus ATCC 62051]|nr:hypothetical protein K438DRAFT_1997296 [Mycena galopus ATCC 62051]